MFRFLTDFLGGFWCQVAHREHHVPVFDKVESDEHGYEVKAKVLMCLVCDRDWEVPS